MSDIKQNWVTFYQIAQFMNPYTGLYEIRKVVLDHDGNIVHTFDQQYTRITLEKYMKSNPSGKFAIYPVYDLGLVGLPNSSETCVLFSPLINTETDMYNNFYCSKYAPF
jgi:hypothetical protein